LAAIAIPINKSWYCLANLYYVKCSSLFFKVLCFAVTEEGTPKISELATVPIQPSQWYTGTRRSMERLFM